jgi:transposase
MVMTLALLVYSVVQRRLRKPLAQHHETVPNQSNQPTTAPTLHWIFQLLAGMHCVQVTVQGQVHGLIEGLNEVQSKSSGCLAMGSSPLKRLSLPKTLVRAW